MQLELSIILSQIFAFLVMLWLLKRFAWKPFYRLVEERKQKIKTDFETAEREKQEAQRLAESYAQKMAHIEEEARQQMRKAIEQGERAAQQIKEEARGHARALLEKVQSDISEEVVKAQAKLKESLVTLVIDTTGKMLEEKLDPEKEKRRVEQFVNEVKLK